LKKIIGTTFAFVLLTAAGSAWAQPHKGSGTFTLSGQINTQLPKGGDATAQGMFNIGFGTFVSERTQLFVGPTLNISAGNSVFGESSSIHAGLGASLGIKQLFGGAAAKTFPYVGLHATVLDFGSGPSIPGFEGGGKSSFLDKMYVGTTVGMKSYFKESVALDLSAQMGAPANDIGSGLRNVSLVAALEYIF